MVFYRFGGFNGARPSPGQEMPHQHVVTRRATRQATAPVFDAAPHFLVSFLSASCQLAHLVVEPEAMRRTK